VNFDPGLTFGAEVARFLETFNQLSLEKLALIRATRHVTEVLAEVVHASWTPTQESIGKFEVIFQIKKLLRTATETEVATEEGNDGLPSQEVRWGRARRHRTTRNGRLRGQMLPTKWLNRERSALPSSDSSCL